MYGQLMDGETWLASCHPQPGEAYAQWEKPPHLARLPAGRGFDVLRLHQRLGLTVLWELGEHADTVPVLEEHALPRPWVYILAQAKTADSWPLHPDAVMLTHGEELRVPSPRADGITGVQQHTFLWRTAPTGSGDLADAEQLRTAFARALDPDRQAARIRAARAVFFHGRHRHP